MDTNLRSSIDRNIPSNKKVVLELIGKIIFVLSVVSIFIVTVIGCSGNQKPTVNMTNCTVVESPVDGNMTIKCELNSDDQQTIKESKEDNEDDSKK